MDSKNYAKEVAALEKQLAMETGAPEVERQARKRNPTMLKLQWVAERARKLKRISEEVEAGTYCVDSSEVARAILKYNSF
ncbi:MAG: flagellar biosynthesis anti-sigma factor FlgM [bacterium]|nr:flagellar biosynthesis anti-sigma factor FlgM [bacterium]